MLKANVLDKPKLKLSGAQKKRLIKAKKLAEGTWTPEKPKKKLFNDHRSWRELTTPRRTRWDSSDSQTRRQEERNSSRLQTPQETKSYSGSREPQQEIQDCQARRNEDRNCSRLQTPQETKSYSGSRKPQQEIQNGSLSQPLKENGECLDFQSPYDVEWTYSESPAHQLENTKCPDPQPSQQENRNWLDSYLEQLQEENNCSVFKSPYDVKWDYSQERETSSSDEVAGEIKMAVIDTRHPDIVMNQAQADLVQNRLVDEIDRAPSGSGTRLQFNDTSFSGGVLWITCSNDFTSKWLREKVRGLTALWEGATLTVVKAKDLPKRPTVLAFFPGPVEEEEKVRARLGKQNVDLRVDCWLLLRQRVEEGGQILAYSIDEVSYKTLQVAELTVYYKLGKVLFKVLEDGLPSSWY